MKIQRALGRNAKTAHPNVFSKSARLLSAGQAVLDSVSEYLRWAHSYDDGSALVTSIHSANLQKSALFSARSARMAYLLGKVSLLGPADRKAVVRTQIIEYGAVAEAILLDVVQSVGKHDIPAGARPKRCEGERPIAWSRDGLFTLKAGSAVAQKHKMSFAWLTKEAERLRVIDAALRGKVDDLRTKRNLIHPIIPTPTRYNSSLGSAREAREVVLALRDACLEFKNTHGLPLATSSA